MARERHNDGFEDVKWELVSKKMNRHGFTKSSKQCRERWIQQLNPGLSKEKWSESENRELLAVYKQKGNHWKEISTYFNGRTDNATKNQFFSLLRKGLRKACKRIGRTSNTVAINGLKPKVLSEFFNMTIRFLLEDDHGIKIEKSTNIADFIERFAFAKKTESTCSKELSQEITGVIDYLNQLKLTKKRRLR